MSLEPKYLTKKQIESKAEKILANNRGGLHLRSAVPVDIDHFAEFHLEVTFDYERLSKDGSILGLSVFQELSM